MRERKLKAHLDSTLIALAAAKRELESAGYVELAKRIEPLLNSVRKQLTTMSAYKKK